MFKLKLIFVSPLFLIFACMTWQPKQPTKAETSIEVYPYKIFEKSENLEAEKYQETKSSSQQAVPQELVTFQKPFVVHKVKSGESLSLISKYYTGSYNNWEEIAEYNQIPDPNKIIAGQEIKIPKRICITALPPEGPLKEQSTFAERIVAVKKEVLSQNKKIEEQRLKRKMGKFGATSLEAKTTLKKQIKEEKIKEDVKIFKQNIGDIWNKIVNILKEDNIPIKLKSEEKHFVMTEYTYKNGLRYRYTITLSSLGEKMTRVNLICIVQTKKGESWENVEEKAVRNLKNMFYTKLRSLK